VTKVKFVYLLKVEDCKKDRVQIMPLDCLVCNLTARDFGSPPMILCLGDSILYKIEGGLSKTEHEHHHLSDLFLEVSPFLKAKDSRPRLLASGVTTLNTSAFPDSQSRTLQNIG
jgi:hypothetical protein